MSQRRLSAYFYLILAALIWGIAGPVIKFTLNEFPPLIFLTYRFFLAAVFSTAMLAIFRPKLSLGKTSPMTIILVCFFTSTVRLGLLFLGFDKTTSISGNLIASMAPVLITAGGAFFFHERVTRWERIGLLLALIGTGISVVEPVFAAATTIYSTVQGNFLVVLSLFIDVASILMAKVVLKKSISAVNLSHFMFIVGFFTIIPITFIYHDWNSLILTIRQASLTTHLGVWYMAFISGSLGYALHFKGLKSIEAGEASIFNYLTPLFGAPFSLFWLGEKITLPFIFGALLIAAGVALAEYKRRRI